MYWLWPGEYCLCHLPSLDFIWNGSSKFLCEHPLWIELFPRVQYNSRIIQQLEWPKRERFSPQTGSALTSTVGENPSMLYKCRCPASEWHNVYSLSIFLIKAVILLSLLLSGPSYWGLGRALHMLVFSHVLLQNSFPITPLTAPALCKVTKALKQALTWFLRDS